MQFSSVALIDDVAELVERVAYDAYGRARHRPVGDIDGDGDVDASDESLFDAAATTYNVDADFDRDLNTSSDTEDTAIFNAAHVTAALAAGRISDNSLNGPDNPVGYDAYLYNPEIEMYTVRFRHYHPEYGRWWERDPKGYIDGLSLYAYVTSMPSVFSDPMGLSPSLAPPVHPDWLIPSVAPPQPTVPPADSLSPRIMTPQPKAIQRENQPALTTWKGCPATVRAKGLAELAEVIGKVAEGYSVKAHAKRIDSQTEACLSGGGWPVLSYPFRMNIGPKDLKVDCASDPCAAKGNIRDAMEPFYNGWNDWENGYYMLGRDYHQRQSILHPDLRDWRIYELMREQLATAGETCSELSALSEESGESQANCPCEEDNGGDN